MSVRADEALRKYLERTTSGSAKEAYKRGIDSVTDSPMAKAAEADDLFLTRVEESVRSGRRKQALMAVPISRWKENSKGKGADRLGSGAQAAADKVRAHFTKWGPIYDNVRDTVRAMPKGTREDSKARAAKAIDMLMDAAGRT